VSLRLIIRVPSCPHGDLLCCPNGQALSATASVHPPCCVWWARSDSLISHRSFIRASPCVALIGLRRVLAGLLAISAAGKSPADAGLFSDPGLGFPGLHWMCRCDRRFFFCGAFAATGPRRAVHEGPPWMLPVGNRSITLHRGLPPSYRPMRSGCLRTLGQCSRAGAYPRARSMRQDRCCGMAQSPRGGWGCEVARDSGTWALLAGCR